MSGNFEDVSKKVDAAKADNASQDVSPFHEELHSLKAPEKVENKGSEEKQAFSGNDGFKEGGKESYSDYLARTKTSDEILEGLRKHIDNSMQKISLLEKNGYGDETKKITEGGNFLGGYVQDSSPAGVRKFLDTIAEALKQKGN